MTAGAFDFEDIASALATAFGPANISPPTGLEPLRSSTHRLPENVTELPATLVFPFRAADLEYDPYARSGGFVWPVRVFFPIWPLPDRISNLYQWAQVLYATYPVSTAIDLGLGAYVRYAVVSAISITTFIYGSGAAAAWKSSVPGSIGVPPSEYPIIEIQVSTLLGEPLA